MSFDLIVKGGVLPDGTRADIVRNAPPTAISALPAITAPMRMAVTEMPCASTAEGFSPAARTASPSGVR